VADYWGNRWSSGMWPEHLDTRELARACNTDCRFQDAGWAETPVSIERLLLSGVFLEAFAKLQPKGAPPLLGVVVATAYRCRLGERGTPRGGPSDKVGFRSR